MALEFRRPSACLQLGRGRVAMSRTKWSFSHCASTSARRGRDREVVLPGPRTPDAWWRSTQPVQLELRDGRMNRSGKRLALACSKSTVNSAPPSAYREETAKGISVDRGPESA